MDRLEEVIISLIKAENTKLRACNYPLVLLHTLNKSKCKKWAKFIRTFNKQRESSSPPSSACPVAGSPCQESSKTKLSFVVSLASKNTKRMLSVVYVTITNLSSPQELAATLDSCTLRKLEGKGLNKLLRTIICHMLVTQLNCVWLYNFTSNPASAHLVKERFKWTESHDDDLNNRIAEASRGDLVEFIGDYRSSSSPAFEALITLYRQICTISSITLKKKSGLK